MSDHSKALVTLSTWSYLSPELRFRKKTVDIGLLAETLIYYDQVLFNVANQDEFAALLSWFIRQGKFVDLVALLKDGTLQVYDYAFISSAVDIHGEYNLFNIQDEIEAQRDSFMQRYLNHTSVRRVLEVPRRQKSLEGVLRDRVIEVKADAFTHGIENARTDFSHHDRCTLLMQAFLDDVYPLLGWEKAPAVVASVNESNGRQNITWNVDLDQISIALGKDLNFHRGAPLTAAAHANRFLWSAASINCDLYLGSPMSVLVGDKLYESERRTVKPKIIIEQLNSEVEFPDIRTLVNSGKFSLNQVLSIRKEAKRFRQWLQTEGERDRNAIIAYHNEVAKQGHWSRFGRKGLRLFGFLGGTITGAVVGTAIAGIPGTIMGATAGKGVEFVLDLGAKLGEGWKPVVFGNWLQNRIENTLSSQNDPAMSESTES